MKQLIGILALAALICGGSACTKKNGENQGLTPENQLPYDLTSNKPGSWWIYGSKDGTIFTRYATGTDSVVNTLSYAYYYRRDSSSKFITPEYFGKNGSKYLTLIDVDGAMSTYLTFVFLKDPATKNVGWRNTESKKIQGWNVDMLIESNVVRTDGVLVHEGHTFTDVIEISSQLKAKLKLAPEYTDCGDLRVWLVRGIGIVKEVGDIKIKIAGITMLTKNYDDSLITYHIEP